MVPGTPTGSAARAALRRPPADRRQPSRCSTQTARWRRSADAALVGFGGVRRRGCSPDGPATGPFATSYAAYRHAMTTTRVAS